MKNFILKFLKLLTISIFFIATSIFIFYLVINRPNHIKHVGDLALLVFIFFPIAAILIGVVGNFITKTFWIPIIVSILIFITLDILSPVIRGGSLISMSLTLISSGVAQSIREINK